MDVIFCFLFSVLAEKAECLSNPKVSVAKERERPITAIPSLSTYVFYEQRERPITSFPSLSADMSYYVDREL